MISELKARDRADLILLGWGFAGLVLKTLADAEWLKERFNAMEELFQDSPVYQLIAKDKLELGSLQQSRKMLVHYVQKRFPVLAPLAEEQAVLIESLDILNNTIDAINDAETVEEARRVLEAAHQG
jgi:hypothetical protein